jgi:hypothetical protein
MNKDIKNFTTYWESKKEIYEKLGVSKEAARMIWNDCADLIEKFIVYKSIGL